MFYRRRFGIDLGRARAWLSGWVALALRTATGAGPRPLALAAPIAAPRPRGRRTLRTPSISGRCRSRGRHVRERRPWSRTRRPRRS